MRPSLDTASEQGAGPGCLAPFVRVRLAAFSGSDGFRSGGAGHRGAVGRHRQMKRPQLVTCDTASRDTSGLTTTVPFRSRRPLYKQSRRPSHTRHSDRYTRANAIVN